MKKIISLIKLTLHLYLTVYNKATFEVQYMGANFLHLYSARSGKENIK